MADDRPGSLPWRRHVNGLVLGGLLTALAIPFGSTLAEYEGEPMLNLISLGTAAVAFGLLAWGLSLGPLRDDRRVARRGIPARVVVEEAKASSMTMSRNDSAVARVVRLDVRVEPEDGPSVRVRLRRWVQINRLPELAPGAVLAAKVLPGRPQDPALGLRHPARTG